MKKTFSVIAILQDAWKLFLEHKRFYLEVVLVFGLIAVVADVLKDDQSMRLVDVVLLLINMVATWYGSVVLMKASLSIASNKPIPSDVYNVSVSTVITLVVGSILTGLGALVGLAFFIVPGIVFALRSGLTQYIILDQHLNSVLAIQKSLELTKGYVWTLLRLMLCFIVLALVSIFPLLGLGFIVLIPVSTIAMSLVYHKIQAEHGVTVHV